MQFHRTKNPTALELSTILSNAVKLYFQSKADAQDDLTEAKAYADTKLATVQLTTVLNTLSSASTTAALSAAQGKELKTLIDNINTLLSSDDTALDDLQEVVSFIKTNKSTLDSLAVANIAGLQAALNSKEPAIGAKETGFNKPVGTTAGTIAAGDDTRIVNAVQGSVTQAQVNTLFTA